VCWCRVVGVGMRGAGGVLGRGMGAAVIAMDAGVVSVVRRVIMVVNGG